MLSILVIISLVNEFFQPFNINHSESKISNIFYSYEYLYTLLYISSTELENPQMPQVLFAGPFI